MKDYEVKLPAGCQARAGHRSAHYAGNSAAGQLAEPRRLSKMGRHGWTWPKTSLCQRKKGSSPLRGAKVQKADGGTKLPQPLNRLEDVVAELHHDPKLRLTRPV